MTATRERRWLGPWRLCLDLWVREAEFRDQSPHSDLVWWVSRRLVIGPRVSEYSAMLDGGSTPSEDTP